MTRADVLVELADPTKSDPWQRYCNRWWLVVAEPELLDDLWDQLPDTWGVLGPPSGRRTRSMTILRPAPRLRPNDQTPALRTLATRLHWQNHRVTHERDAIKADYAQARDTITDLRARVPAAERPRGRQAELVDDIVRRLGGPAPEGGDRIGRSWDTDIRVDDVVTALTDLGAARRQAQRASWPIDAAARQLQDLLTNVDRGEIAKAATRAAQARADLDA